MSDELLRRIFREYQASQNTDSALRFMNVYMRMIGVEASPVTSQRISTGNWIQLAAQQGWTNPEIMDSFEQIRSIMQMYPDENRFLASRPDLEEGGEERWLIEECYQSFKDGYFDLGGYCYQCPCDRVFLAEGIVDTPWWGWCRDVGRARMADMADADVGPGPAPEGCPFPPTTLSGGIRQTASSFGSGCNTCDEIYCGQCSWIIRVPGAGIVTSISGSSRRGMGYVCQFCFLNYVTTALASGVFDPSWR